jgi:putative peptidoglycan lipid II flippase
MAEEDRQRDEGHRGGGLAAATAIIFLGSVGSRLLGLVREQLAASRFGAGDEIAAFTVAENTITLLFDLTLNGMLQAALVPVLAAYALGNVIARREFREITSALLVIAAGLGLLLSIAGFVAAPRLVRVMTGPEGQQERGEATFELAVSLLRTMMPALFFLLIGVVLMASLYAGRHPLGPSLGAAARNAAIVISVVLLSAETGVRSMAYGVVAGSVFLVLLQVIFLARRDELPSRRIALKHPALRRIGFLYAPVFVGLVVTSGGVVLDRNLAWRAEEDALGAMRYATTLVQLLLGLVAAAVSLAILPTLSRHFSEGDEAAFGRSLRTALEFVTFLMVPAVVGLAVLARPTVSLLFEHGQTGPAQADLIVVALLAYLPGHLLAAYDQVLIFAFYARQNTILPVLVGIGAVGVYAVVALTLVDRYGMLGLVIANSCQLGAHTIIMVWLASRRFAFNLWREIQSSSLRVAAAAALMAVIVFAVVRLLTFLIAENGEPLGLISELIVVAVPVTLGAVSYLVIARRLGVDYLSMLTGPILSRIGR